MRRGGASRRRPPRPKRPAHKRHGGLWEFPGGKLETDEDSAQRELAEELGVRVVSADAPELETRDPGSEFLIAFVPVRIDGEPECREHSALTWGCGIVPIFVWRARAEERLLSRAFGESYVLCRRQTRMIIPL